MGLHILAGKEFKDVILNEYERKTILYKLTDERFKKKYGMDFSAFEKRNLVKEKDFSWEVEKDAMEWEHAMESIEYLLQKNPGVTKTLLSFP